MLQLKPLLVHMKSCDLEFLSVKEHCIWQYLITVHLSVTLTSNPTFEKITILALPVNSKLYPRDLKSPAQALCATQIWP